VKGYRLHTHAPHRLLLSRRQPVAAETGLRRQGEQGGDVGGGTGRRRVSYGRNMGKRMGLCSKVCSNWLGWDLSAISNEAIAKLPRWRHSRVRGRRPHSHRAAVRRSNAAATLGDHR
jgi:hypothetical protein